jgi:hypothetical protein
MKSYDQGKTEKHKDIANAANQSRSIPLPQVNPRKREQTEYRSYQERQFFIPIWSCYTGGSSAVHVDAPELAYSYKRLTQAIYWYNLKDL